MALHPLVLKFKPWSISKLGVLQKCTRQFHWKHIERRKEAMSGPASRIGTAIHGVLQDCLTDYEPVSEERFLLHANKEKLLHTDLLDARAFLPAVDPFVKRIKAFEQNQGVSRRSVEGKVGVRADFTPCDFDDPDCLIRGVIDYWALTRALSGVVLDHKTGKKKSLDSHTLQLNTYMLFLVALIPEVVTLQPVIHYVGDPKLDWMDPVSAEYVRRRLRPWLEQTLNRNASELSVVAEGKAWPRTGWQCEWCGFSETCPEGALVVAERQAAREEKQQPNL